MILKSLSIAVLLAALATPALAQSDDGIPVRLRGTLTGVSDLTLTLTEKGGKVDTIQRSPKLRVATVKAASLGDIKTGDFVGSAAIKNPDGTYRALEVHIFPAAMRGTGEGFHSWDQGPDSAMINASVGPVVATADGRSMTLATEGKQARIMIGSDTPVVLLVPGDAGLLVTGKAATIFAMQTGEAQYTARSVTIESNGVKPPM